MECCDHEHEEYDYMECVKVGQKIRNFSMEAYDPTEGGFTVVDSEKIQKKKKWLVLVFYPADFTFVCPTELADLAAKHAKLKKLGAEVVSVSTKSMRRAQMAPKSGGSTRVFKAFQGWIGRQVQGGPNSTERVRAGVLPVWIRAMARISAQRNQRAWDKARSRFQGQGQPRDSQ